MLYFFRRADLWFTKQAGWPTGLWLLVAERVSVLFVFVVVVVQAAQGRAARKKLGKGGKIDPQHLSPACVWLDAQHDSRHGARFIESITGGRRLSILPPVASRRGEVDGTGGGLLALVLGYVCLC